MRRSTDTLEAYALLSPFLVVFALFLFYPLLYSLQLSLYQVSLHTDWFDAFGAMKWAGLDNYVHLITRDHRFLWSLVFTFAYGLLTVPAGIAVGLGLALLIQRVKGAGLYRSLLFLPNVLDVFVVGTVWSAILAPRSGMVDRALAGLGASVPLMDGGFLGNPYFVLPTIALAMVLKGAGFGMVLMTTSLNQISESLYEAAALDGADAWQRFWNVTYPSIRGMVVFMAITGTMACLNAFAEIYALTGGTGGPRVLIGETPIRPGDLSGFYLFRVFQEGRYGYAAAMSFLLMFLAILISVATRTLVGDDE